MAGARPASGWRGQGRRLSWPSAVYTPWTFCDTGQGQPLPVAERVQIHAPGVSVAGRDGHAAGREGAPREGGLDAVEATLLDEDGALDVARPVLVTEGARRSDAARGLIVVVEVAV